MIKILIEGTPAPANRSAMAGAAPLTGAICAAVNLYRRAQSTAQIFVDVDNHLKAICDGMNRLGRQKLIFFRAVLK